MKLFISQFLIISTFCFGGPFAFPGAGECSSGSGALLICTHIADSLEKCPKNSWKHGPSSYLSRVNFPVFTRLRYEDGPLSQCRGAYGLNNGAMNPCNRISKADLQAFSYRKPQGVQTRIAPSGSPPPPAPVTDTCYADTSICIGDTLRIGGELIAAPGTYLLSSGIPSSCEALVLEVAERNRYEVQMSIRMCHGENARFGDYTFGRSGLYEIRLPALNGCDTFIFLDLIVSNIGSPSFQTEPDDGSGNGAIDLDLNRTGISFQWSNGATTEDIEGLEAGEYTVTVTNSDDCQVIRTVRVKKLERFIMPGAFTPNGDGVNDHFNVVVNEGAPRVLAFRVYNRWGQLVYDNDDPEQGWDGAFKGEPQASDTYFYFVQVERQVGPEEVLSFQGDVVLLR